MTVGVEKVVMMVMVAVRSNGDGGEGDGKCMMEKENLCQAYSVAKIIRVSGTV